MGYDKVIDSAQLDTDLTSVANAIRTKGGTSASLTFPAEFVSAIGAIPSRGDIYYASSGAPYVPDMIFPNFLMNGSIYKDATNLETVVCNETRQCGGYGYNINEYFKNCTKLKSVEMPYVPSFRNSYCDRVFQGCTALESATFGSVGYPLTQFANYTDSYYYPFSNDTQSNLTITIYVDASTLADIPTEVTSAAPWGATNATIIYRSSTTGEVLT